MTRFEQVGTIITTIEHEPENMFSWEMFVIKLPLWCAGASGLFFFALTVIIAPWLKSYHHFIIAAGESGIAFFILALWQNSNWIAANGFRLVETTEEPNVIEVDGGQSRVISGHVIETPDKQIGSLTLTGQTVLNYRDRLRQNIDTFIRTPEISGQDYLDRVYQNELVQLGALVKEGRAYYWTEAGISFMMGEGRSWNDE